MYANSFSTSEKLASKSEDRDILQRNDKQSEARRKLTHKVYPSFSPK